MIGSSNPVVSDSQTAQKSPGLLEQGKRLLASFCCTDGGMGSFTYMYQVKIFIAPWLQKGLYKPLTHQIQILSGYFNQNLEFLLKGLAARWISIVP